MVFVFFKDNGQQLFHSSIPHRISVPECLRTVMSHQGIPAPEMSRRDRQQLAVRLGQSLRQVDRRIRQGGISVITLPSGRTRVLIQNRREH